MSIDHSGKSSTNKVGFLLLTGGGAGAAAGDRALKEHEAAGAGFPLYVARIDTDGSKVFRCHRLIDISLQPDHVEAIMANPHRFGPACVVLKECFPGLLTSETVGTGSRTTRIITQAHFEVNREYVARALRDSIAELRGQGDVRCIVVIVVCSEAGGTGSALQALLLPYFTRPDLRQQLLNGLPDNLLREPLCFVMDSFVHASNQKDACRADWVMGNNYASRAEMAYREVRGERYNYVFHLGLSSRAVVFRRIEDLTEAAGLTLYSLMEGYSAFRSRAVDSLDFIKERARYQGQDTFEEMRTQDQSPGQTVMNESGEGSDESDRGAEDEL